MRTLLRGVLTTGLVLATLLIPVSASAQEWATPTLDPPSWVRPGTGLRMAQVGTLGFDGPMVNLTNTGRLGKEEVAWYGFWVFPKQRLDIRLDTATDFVLVFQGETTPLLIADSVRGGSESITFVHNDSNIEGAVSAEFMWIGVGAYTGGAYTLRTTMTDPPVAPSLKRISGSDRYATAVKASQDAFPDGAGTVIVATGVNFADALAAAGLCGVYDAPLLLVPPATLPSAVSGEIDRLGATRAIIVGGTSAVSSAVQRSLEARPALSGGVTRISGANRYETARRIAEAMKAELGTPLTEAIVVCGTNFADALSATPLAYADRRPILLTPTGYAHSTVLSALDSLGVENVTIIGGVPAVSAYAEQQIESRLGDQAQRWAGATRFETARVVAEKSVETGAVSREFIGYANGFGFADGLSGGVAVGQMGGVLLLTQPWVEPAAMQAFNFDSADDVASARVYGGPTVVWGNVLGMINDDMGLVLKSLWRPAADALPDSGNYVYLDSDVDDYIGGGREYIYTPADTAIELSTYANRLHVVISGSEQWIGDFVVPDEGGIVRPGYYPNLSRYPYNYSALGGLNWSGEGRASTYLNGWFVVDSVTYTDDVITAIDLRFEQHSEGREPALHGAIHWTPEG